MTFAGINHLAIFIAAVVAWLAGAIYYTVLAKPWVAAQGLTVEQHKAMIAAKSGIAKFAPFILAFVAEVIMAWVLAGMVGHLGAVTIRSAVISGLFVWAGFVVTTLLVNNAFAGRRYMLTLIDAGHWLLVVVLMGVVIGWMGV
jgi:Protein of unknown function (DUF1761)